MPEAVKSVTVDNGPEFAYHYRLADSLGVPTYFCDPYSAYQRGTNEHFNGRIRKYLPKGTSFQDLDQEELDDIIHEINNRLRKVFGWLCQASGMVEACFLFFMQPWLARCLDLMFYSGTRTGFGSRGLNEGGPCCTSRSIQRSQPSLRPAQTIPVGRLVLLYKQNSTLQPWRYQTNHPWNRPTRPPASHQEPPRSEQLYIAHRGHCDV